MPYRCQSSFCDLSYPRVFFLAGLQAPEAGETNADYYPSLSSNVLGENYFDRDLHQLFILIRGEAIVEVVTTPVIMTTFGVPAVEVDNFFEENIVQNLANLLNIPPSKIRVVEIISEDSVRRRRRATGEVEVVVEIGDQPSATSSSTEASNSTMATPTALPNGMANAFISSENIVIINNVVKLKLP